MRGHAGAEIEGNAVEMIAAARGTVRAAFLEAGDMRIAIVPEARALREDAAERRQMTDLRCGEAKRRSRKGRIGLVDARVRCDRGDRGESADARSPVGAAFDTHRIGHGCDIDQRTSRKSAASPFGKVSTGGA